ncbi:MAG: hypothetical protein EPN45_04055, partial [Rhizobiaceae bacterium]
MSDASPLSGNAADSFSSRLFGLLSSSATATPVTTTPVVALAAARAAQYRIPASIALGAGGAKAKFAGNIEAIRVLRVVESEGRGATDAEKDILVRYVGWGGLPQAFRRPNGVAADGWLTEVETLESLLSPADLDAARRSTQDSHYTPRDVIEAMYAGLQRLGFTGGHVLEPAVGTGHFIGLAPDALREAMRWTTVELDTITAGIAKALYPEANVIHRAFQDVVVPGASVDLVIGNPPFGNTIVHDSANTDLAGFSLHNFFFARALKALVPGGLLAMVVSSSLMDKSSGMERRWMAERAHLVGAIRLPNDAFKANAGTSVTTDIVFLKKLLPGEVVQSDLWAGLGQIEDALGGDPIEVNAYFAAHPEMMLGHMARVGSMYCADAPALTPIPGAILADQLASAIALLPEGIAQAPVSTKDCAVQFPAIPQDVPVFGHYIAPDASIWIREADVLDSQAARRIDVQGRDHARLSGLIQLRTALRAVLSTELSNAPDGEIVALREALNTSYDTFVSSFGFLNSTANVNAFRDDADAYLVRALEADYQRLDALDVERRGLTLPKGRSTLEIAEKAAIMHGRVLHPSITPRAETASDALAISLNMTGRVNVPMMAELLVTDEQSVIDELGDAIFRTPSGHWVPADLYLSGNVKAALASARAAAAQNTDFVRNVAALEAVQPADLPPGDIYVALGSPWVPGQVYADFAAEILGLGYVSVTLVEEVQRFIVRAGSCGHSRFGIDGMSAREIFAKAVSREAITITKRTADDRYVLDPVATDAARQAVELMAEAFVDWVWNNPERREQLTRIYNDRFNTDAPRRYDGSHLTFPGKVSDDVIKLRTSQVNAIWRMIQDGVVLLDHVVGSGKTWAAIAAIMESRRMGLIKKSMIAVPNHLVDQWACDVLRLYPGAKLLAVSEADFTKTRRKLLFARVATGDWDIVVLAHSQLTRVEVPASFMQEYLEEKISDYRDAIAALQASGADNRTVKQAEAARDKIKEKLKRILNGVRHDNDTASIEDMGIDCLCIDESQYAKNLSFVTRKRNVSGLGNPVGSQRAEDLYIKVRYLQQRKENAAVYFLSGTPVSNSIAELFTVQRFLAYDQLRTRGIHLFDLWANTFCEESTSYELDATGRGIKPKTVLKKFLNVPEMLAIYRRVADTVTQDDLKVLHLERTGTPWPVPNLLGGKPVNVVVPAGGALLDYIENDIIPRMQAVSGETGSRPDPSVDNFLKITNDARLAALDVRLRRPLAEDAPTSKTNLAVDNLVAIHEAWAALRGTQLVFCDLSTPKASQASEMAAHLDLVSRAEAGDEKAQAALDNISQDAHLALSSSFSVYDDLRSKLIARGVAPHEIAFIHDAKTDVQKRVLFAKVNRGDVRILMGSTAKMGAGMNVQARLVALHHLDCPWRPSDLAQREGRIIRQGNLFYAASPNEFEVAIYRYANERTYDARQWQLIERKACIVDQMRKND